MLTPTSSPPRQPDQPKKRRSFHGAAAFSFAQIKSKNRESITMGLAARTRLTMLELALNKLDRVAERRHGDARLPAHLAVGMEGEDAAFFYLRRKGYTVVAKRWSSGDAPGDVDLIAWNGPMLCFIEVKTRTAHDLTPAEAAVDRHKRANLRRLAHRYVRQLPQSSAPPIRFDVISVYLVPGHEREFVHFEGSFDWNEGQRD